MRQQTLRGAIDWSHDLLEEDERVLFARLSVFVGGCTLEAAEEVCDPEDDLLLVDVLDGLASLVDKSLLREQEERGSGEPRFFMLGTIREYAREKLGESTGGKRKPGLIRLHAILSGISLFRGCPRRSSAVRQVRLTGNS